VTLDGVSACAGVVSRGVGTIGSKTSKVVAVENVLTTCVGSARNRDIVGDLYGKTWSFHVRRMKWM